MRQEVVQRIGVTFSQYCSNYENALTKFGFQPWCRTNRSMHESNQVSLFLEAYKYSSNDPSNILTWHELPIPAFLGNLKQEIQHIDGFIIDNNLKSIFFIEAKRISHQRRIGELSRDDKRMFDIRKEIYHGNGDFRGLNLFEYDAFVISLADIWASGKQWGRKIVDNWDDECEHMFSEENPLKNGVKEIITDYFVGYSLVPLFDSKEYSKCLAELNEPNNELRKTALKERQYFYKHGKHHTGEGSGILAWSDELEFERLLADLNWEESDD